MIDSQKSEIINKAVVDSNTILIALSSSPTYDHVSAALALFLSLKDGQKNVQIVCSSPMAVEFSRIVGVDKIKTKVGNQNLVVSFDYIQDGIEKVSYHVEGKKFNLVVQPKKGTKPLDPKTVSYSYQGLSVDLVFCIGCTSLESMGGIYHKNKKSFDSTHIVSLHIIDHPPFAQNSIIYSQASSVSEMTYNLISTLQTPLSVDAAGNLLAGMDIATNRFSSPRTPASSFTIAGQLMQIGAKRSMVIERPKIPNIPIPNLSPNIPKPLIRPMSPVDSQSETPPHPADISTAPIEDVVSPGQTTIKEVGSDAKNNTPKDWLEPKIYRGSTKV